MTALQDKDYKILRTLGTYTRFKPWFPKNPSNPVLQRLVAAGYLEISMMKARCGFECWDQMGAKWTRAGIDAAKALERCE